MHLHVNRGKRSVVLDLQDRRGQATLFLELVPRRRRRRRGDAARARSPRLRPRLRRPAARSTRRSCSCTISGYGATGPYKDLPSHGIAYDTWAGIVTPAVRRRRLLLHPRARVDRHQRRAAVRRARHPRRRHPGRARRARAAPWSSRSPTPPPPSTGTAARRTAPTSARSPRSPATSPTTTSAARPAPPACARACATRSTTTSDGHVLFMASEQAFWKNFCEALGRMDLFERWPGSKYADHARGNRELQAELRDDLRRRGRAPEWIDFGDRAQHPDRAGQHAADARRRPAVPGPARVDLAERRSAPTSCRSRSSSSAASCPSPTKAPDARPAHRRRPARRPRLSDDEIAALREAGALG